ncbi:MAG: hypothetical protein K2X03_12870 [Bryobacteraceae bacterium]|nr:hypothetical protein [Bryobacteraceae bacterium]
MTFTKDAHFEQLQNDMTAWVGALAKPFTPPKEVPVGDDGYNLEFWDKRSETVMLGKLVRAMSGMNAAVHLAEIGYVTECGALLRVVSDLCDEISTIGLAIHKVDQGETMNPEVEAFVSQYFKPMAKSPDEFANQAKVRYVSRERLLVAKVNMSPPVPGIDSDMFLKLARFQNKTYDCYVHGYFESTMELWNPKSNTFELTGRTDAYSIEGFIEAAMLKFHGLVTAIEITAHHTGNQEVFQGAREARRKLDELGISADPRKT